MAILLPALSRAREAGKRVVFLSDLRQLTIAWITYTEANNDKIVNAAARGGADCGPDCTDTSYQGYGAQAPPQNDWDYPNHANELPWVGNGWGDWCTGQYPPEGCQRCAMATGALWKFLKDPQIYHCPTGIKGQMVSYTIMDNMNGLGINRTNNPLARSLTYKNRNQIKRPVKKIVFIDEGRLTPDSFAIRYNGPWGWWDGPFVRHGNGTTVSFADGHASWWLWKSKSTVDLGKAKETGNPCNMMTTQPPNILTDCGTFNDFYKIWESFYGNQLSAAGVTPPAGCQLETAEY